MTFQHNANGNWDTPDTSNGQYRVFNPASGQLAIVPEPSTRAMTLMAAGSAAWSHASGGEWPAIVAGGCRRIAGGA